MTGAADVAIASCMVFGETCERSISMPMRFISRTTSLPKGVRPLWTGPSVAESAQSLFFEWVSVM
jgi:hypothetical protein